MNRNKLNVINKIIANVTSREQKWLCLRSGCNNNAINSHLIQRNPILSSIAANGEVYELKENNVQSMYKKGQLGFRRTGTGKALSLPVFCEEHDQSLFRSIEYGQDYSLFNYYVQSLLSYRSCCSEIRRKEIIVEVQKRVIDSKTFQNTQLQKDAETFKYSNQLGIRDLNVFKRSFENELFISLLAEGFTYKTVKLPLTKVCASGLFSLINYHDRSIYSEQREALPTVFINLIPKDGFLFLVIGYNNAFKNNWITSFVESWNDVLDNYTARITDILARMNSWCISPDVYNRIPEWKRKAFINYWNKNSTNLDMNQKINIDLFSDLM